LEQQRSGTLLEAEINTEFPIWFNDNGIPLSDDLAERILGILLLVASWPFDERIYTLFPRNQPPPDEGEDTDRRLDPRQLLLDSEEVRRGCLNPLPSSNRLPEEIFLLLFVQLNKEGNCETALPFRPASENHVCP
jgi:hypothetical protein